MQKIALFIFISLALTGCKVDLNANLNLSDIQSHETKQVNAALSVEVISCSDYRDSRKESDSLIEVKQSIPVIFDGANYLECYRSGMESLAVFNTPILVGGQDLNGDLQITNHLKNQPTSGIFLKASERFRNRLQRYQEKTMGNFKPTISLTITNDLDIPESYFLYSVFVNDDGQPFLDASFLVGNSPNLKLSDTSLDHLLKKGWTVLAIKS